MQNTASASKAVQFGTFPAAEFKNDEPPASAMKHLADDEDARRRHFYNRRGNLNLWTSKKVPQINNDRWVRSKFGYG